MVAGSGTIEAIKISFSDDLNLAVLNPHTVHNISF
jgi:hypothetical protein